MARKRSLTEDELKLIRTRPSDIEAFKKHEEIQHDYR